MQVIHFHKVTGQISAWGTGDSDDSHLTDHRIVRLDVPHIDPRLHRINVETDQLSEISAGEIALADRPTVDEVQAAIVAQLQATDAFMMPDRPLSDPARAAWAVYRQALRDLSNRAAVTVADMLAAFPQRPDGADPVASLRLRLAAAEG